jgi:membrane-bound lytic murein transglycosylase B
MIDASRREGRDMHIIISNQPILAELAVPAIRRAADVREAHDGEDRMVLSAPGLPKIVVKKPKIVIKKKPKPKRPGSDKIRKLPALPEKGWARLMNRLERDGVSPQQVQAVYLSQQMPEFRQVPFKLNPQESPHIYQGHTAPARMERAATFLKTYEQTFKKAQRETGVDYYLVAAIISVESDCGLNFGRQLVINRLSRLANIGEEQNLDYVFAKLQAEDKSVTREQVAQRAFVLEQIFYPQVLALFQLAREQKVSILGLRGSSAGGIGYPQFLPVPWQMFGRDGNRDGIVSLFQAEDAILSCAQYLKKYGWKAGASEAEQLEVLKEYNNSGAYGQAVLKVRDLLRDIETTEKTGHR